jgi:hypothetical protein
LNKSFFVRLEQQRTSSSGGMAWEDAIHPTPDLRLTGRASSARLASSAPSSAAERAGEV